MKQYGLVGKEIDYSFSREYFKVKFDKEGLSDHTYVNYDFTSIEEFSQLLSEGPLPTGLNVTIPYKKRSDSLFR